MNGKTIADHPEPQTPAQYLALFIEHMRRRMVENPAGPAWSDDELRRELADCRDTLEGGVAAHRNGDQDAFNTGILANTYNIARLADSEPASISPENALLPAMAIALLAFTYMELLRQRIAEVEAELADRE